MKCLLLYAPRSYNFIPYRIPLVAVDTVQFVQKSLTALTTLHYSNLVNSFENR